MTNIIDIKDNIIGINISNNNIIISNNTINKTIIAKKNTTNIKNKTTTKTYSIKHNQVSASEWETEREQREGGERKKGAPGGDREKSSKGEQIGKVKNFLKDCLFVFFCI